MLKIRYLSLNISLLLSLAIHGLLLSLAIVSAPISKKIVLKIRNLGTEQGKINDLELAYSEDPFSKKLSAEQPYIEDNRKTQREDSYSNPYGKRNIYNQQKVTTAKLVKAEDEVLELGKNKRTRTVSITSQEASYAQFHGQNDIPLFSQSGFNLQFKIPKGAPFDELNTLEQMLYSFRKRLFNTFYSSFNQNAGELMRTYPHLRALIPSYKQELTGKLTYSSHGRLIEIQTLKTTNTEILNTFLIDIMEDIPTIPNIPKVLIDENDQFEITLNLTVNPR